MKFGLFFFASALATEIDYDDVAFKKDKCKEPADCNACADMGMKVVRACKFDKVCKNFGMSKKGECGGGDGNDENNECPADPTTCEQCMVLSRNKKCFKPQLKTCQGLGWTKKGCNGDDGDDGCGDAPTTCEECVTLSKNKKCFKPQIKACQGFGWTKKGCNGDDEEENCGDAPTTCEECVALSKNKQCFKSQLDTCVGFGWTKKGCRENCLLAVPATCDACKALSPQCLKPHKATCKNLCSGDGEDDNCGDAPTSCEECVTLSRNKKCFKPQIKTCQGFGWTKKGCQDGNDDECVEPASCADCQGLSKSCLKKNKDFGELCKGFGFSKGKCRSQKG